MARERDLSLPIRRSAAAQLTEPEALLPGLGFDIWQPRVPPVIGDGHAGGTAGERAGLQGGDEILAIDGQPIAHFQQLVEPRQAESGPHGRRCEVRRDGAVARHAR